VFDGQLERDALERGAAIGAQDNFFGQRPG
jgi:hypothetical protein